MTRTSNDREGAKREYLSMRVGEEREIDSVFVVVLVLDPCCLDGASRRWWCRCALLLDASEYDLMVCITLEGSLIPLSPFET